MKFIEKNELVSMAAEMMSKAYAPYSGFKVGAALLASSGKVYVGCNIENAAYTPTVCAERVAFFSAVSSGEREFKAIAIVGGIDGKLTSFTYPCGVCRQVMSEFCGADFKLYFSDGNDIIEYMFDEIMPLSFGAADIGK